MAPFSKSKLRVSSFISTKVGISTLAASWTSPFAMASSVNTGFKKVELVGKPATSSEESISKESYSS